MHKTLFIITAFLTLIPAAVAAAPPWPLRAGDQEKSHTELISISPRRYAITQGGTMDGRNCRFPMGCGISREGAYIQSWESNREVRMENAGDADLVNPWLSNGRNNFRTVSEIVASAITPEMSDAEKAYALWFQEIQY